MNDQLLPLRVEHIQLEPTTRCNLSCTTCLKGQAGVEWVEQDLDPAIVQQLFYKNNTIQTVHLQGWGEPLLSTDLFKIIEQLKNHPVKLSFTTNGTCLTTKMAENIIDTRVDSVTFSMAGGKEQTHDQLRGSHSYQKMMTSINNLLQKRAKNKNSTLKIAISYLLTPQTVKELPKVIRWCRKNRIDKLATVHLTQSSTDLQEKLQYIFQKNNLTQKLQRAWLNILSISGRLDFSLRSYTPSLSPICDKIPGQSLFISAKGDVSPCVFLNPPVKNGIVWQDRGKRQFQKPEIFGNIHQTPLNTILEDTGYREFVGIYERRIKFYSNALSKVSYSLEGAEQLERATKKIARMFQENPPPIPCTHCRKLDGF